MCACRQNEDVVAREGSSLLRHYDESAVKLVTEVIFYNISCIVEHPAQIFLTAEIRSRGFHCWKVRGKA